MPEEKIRYWKISPGERGYNWDEFKDNNLISVGWGPDIDWRKTKFGDLTIDPKKDI